MKCKCMTFLGLSHVFLLNIMHGLSKLATRLVSGTLVAIRSNRHGRKTNGQRQLHGFFAFALGSSLK